MRIYLQENTAAGRRKRFLVIGLALVAVISLIGSLGSYIYWQRLKDTPQYSLALLIDAAKRDDQNEIDELINIDNVVDDFLPQITVKAVEIYGRGLPPAIVGQLTKVAAPMMPAVKDRARRQTPLDHLLSRSSDLVMCLLPRWSWERVNIWTLRSPATMLS